MENICCISIRVHMYSITEIIDLYILNYKAILWVLLFIRRPIQYPRHHHSNMLNNVSRTTWTWSYTVQHHFHELQALIVDYRHKKILIEKTRIEDHQLLPAVLVDNDDFESIYEPFYVIPLFEKLIDSESSLIFLRQIWIDEKDAERNNITYELQNCVLLLEYSGDVSCIGSTYEWISFNQAKLFHLFDEAMKYIQIELKMASNNTEPTNRLPWQRRHWLSKNMIWMEEELQSCAHATLLNPIVYNKSSQFGVILQANTTKGKFFLKCTSSTANDASYTHVLSQIAPEFVAAPLVVDRDNQVMITRDYGTVLDTFALSEIESKQLSKDYARLQKRTVGKDQELVDAGFPDFRVSQLIEYIDNLPMNPIFRLLNGRKDMNSSVVKDIQLFCENRSKFKEQLLYLNDSNIPATVCHNDLFFTNIYKPESSSNFMFFDWVDGYVSHPFLSNMNGIHKYSDLYVQEWLEYGDMDQLKKWAEIGENFQCFAIFIGRMQEANTLETLESTTSFIEAVDYLNQFVKCFI